MNNKFIWLLVIVVIAAALVFYFRWSPTPPANAPSANNENAPYANPSVNAPQAAQQFQPSGDPDTIANNILSDTSQLLPTPSESDPSLVAPSTDISNSFDQSLGANQF